jgi:hypothetical protein
MVSGQISITYKIINHATKQLVTTKITCYYTPKISYNIITSFLVIIDFMVEEEML